MGVVESGCKRIENDQNLNFLDFAATQYDISNYNRIGITSTYLYFCSLADIGKKCEFV